VPAISCLPLSQLGPSTNCRITPPQTGDHSDNRQSHVSVVAGTRGEDTFSVASKTTPSPRRPEPVSVHLGLKSNRPRIPPPQTGGFSGLSESTPQLGRARSLVVHISVNSTARRRSRHLISIRANHRVEDKSTGPSQLPQVFSSPGFPASARAVSRSWALGLLVSRHSGLQVTRYQSSGLSRQGHISPTDHQSRSAVLSAITSVFRVSRTAAPPARLHLGPHQSLYQV
jgi:hypothetical protein